MCLQAVEVSDMLLALRFSDDWKDKLIAEFLVFINSQYGVTRRRWYQYKYLQTRLGVYPWLILYPTPSHLLE